MEPKETQNPNQKADQKEDSLTLKNMTAATSPSSSEEESSSEDTENKPPAIPATQPGRGVMQTSAMFAPPDTFPSAHIGAGRKRANKDNSAEVNTAPTASVQDQMGTSVPVKKQAPPDKSEKEHDERELTEESEPSSLIETFSASDDGQQPVDTKPTTQKSGETQTAAPTANLSQIQKKGTSEAAKTGGHFDMSVAAEKLSNYDSNDEYIMQSDEEDERDVVPGQKTTEPKDRSPVKVDGPKLTQTTDNKKPLSAKTRPPQRSETGAKKSLSESEEDSFDDVRYLVSDSDDESANVDNSNLADGKKNSAQPSSATPSGKNIGQVPPSTFNDAAVKANAVTKPTAASRPTFTRNSFNRTQPTKPFPSPNSYKKSPAKKSPATFTRHKVSPPARNKSKKGSSPAPVVPSQAAKIPASKSKKSTPGRFSPANSSRPSPRSPVSPRKQTPNGSKRSPRKINNLIGETRGSKIFSKPKLAGLEQDSMLQFKVIKVKTEATKPKSTGKQSDSTRTNSSTEDSQKSERSKKAK